MTEPSSEQIGDILGEEELEERRRISAILANSGRLIEIDPEGLLDPDEESEDREPQFGLFREYETGFG